MPTIRQLAQLAGVSIGTVSLALRDDPQISAATRARIKALAEENHYLRNRPARSVFSGKTATVGCIIPVITDSFTSFLLGGFIREVYGHEYQVFIQETHYDIQRCHNALHAMMEHRVDGVLLFPGLGQYTIPNTVITALLSHNIALVSLEAMTDIPIDHVRFDRETFKRQIYEFLIRSGHRQFAAIGPVHQLNPGPMGVILMLLEEQGFPAPRLFPDIAGNNIAAVFAELHRLSPPCTMLLTMNDILAVRLIIDAQRQGIAIPQTYSVLACTSSTFPQVIYPALSVIDSDAAELGSQAAKLMFARIGEDSVCASPARVAMVPPRLLIRESCMNLANKSEAVQRSPQPITIASPPLPHHANEETPTHIQDRYRARCIAAGQRMHMRGDPISKRRLAQEAQVDPKTALKYLAAVKDALVGVTDSSLRSNIPGNTDDTVTQWTTLSAITPGDSLQSKPAHRSQAAQQRIRQAVIALRTRGVPITLRAVAREAHASLSTVSKYRALLRG